jgi:aminopeptidase N
VVTLVIDYSAPPNPNHSDVGFQSGWEHCFTFSEPYGARRWMPCFDQPFDQFDDVTISVNMPEHWSLASNGGLIATSYPEPGRKLQIYEHHHPITTYLIQFAAGSYAPNVFVENGVQYRYFAWPQDSMKAAYDWERTPQMTSTLENWFGDYPFEQYGMVETHIMNGWGAMEHQTMTTYGHQPD